MAVVPVLPLRVAGSGLRAVAVLFVPVLVVAGRTELLIVFKRILLLFS